MSTVAQGRSKGQFDRNAMALYRYGRYQQSKRDNGNFYFGPKSLLLFGAASFLYEVCEVSKLLQNFHVKIQSAVPISRQCW